MWRAAWGQRRRVHTRRVAALRNGRCVTGDGVRHALGVGPCASLGALSANETRVPNTRGFFHMFHTGRVVPVVAGPSELCR